MKSVDDSIQLCAVGDTLYRVSKSVKENKLYVEPITITKAEFVKAGISGHWYYHDNKRRSYFNRNIISSCYNTEKDAQLEIVRRVHIIHKRELLKQYERKLNRDLNIGDHYIIK